MIRIIIALLFIFELWLASLFVSSEMSLVLGAFLMMLLSTSIILSVKLFMSDQHPILGPAVLFAKAPVTILSLYFIFKWQGFESFSFVIGVLIVLPCLVLLSYRKL
jgi:hypothetical protein